MLLGIKTRFSLGIHLYCYKANRQSNHQPNSQAIFIGKLVDKQDNDKYVKKLRGTIACVV